MLTIKLEIATRGNIDVGVQNLPSKSASLLMSELLEHREFRGRN